MKFDLSKFKKVKASGQSTTLKHPKGHEITISHAGVPPKMREQLAALPFADGGDVEDKGVPGGGGSPYINPDSTKGFSKGASESGAPSMSEAWHNIKVGLGVEKEDAPKKPQKKADGGVIDDANSSQMPPKDEMADIMASGAAPQSAPPSAPPQIDPALAEKRELYNSLVSGPGAPGLVGGTFGTMTAQKFGPNGEEPKAFIPEAWSKAEDAFKEQAAQKQTSDMAMAQKAQQDNQSRVAAGLQPTSVPVNALAAASPEAARQPAAAAPQAPQGASDPYGTQAYSDSYMRGIQEQKAGLSKEAAAEGALGKVQAAQLEKANQMQQANLQNYQDHFQGLEKERQAFQKDIDAQHIDPNHYLSDMGAGSKIATAIGLIAGGIGGGLLHQENPALKFLNAQIDRDISAQKANLGKKENLLSANMRQFGNLKDATDMTRVMQSDIMSNQLKAEAAKAQDPIAKARLLQAAGKLDMETAPVVSQIAMRKTLLGGAQAGTIAPEHVIRMIVPQGEQQHAYKELKEAQDTTAFRDNLLSAIGQLEKNNTVGNRVAHLGFEPAAVKALKDPLVAALSKQTAGRFTEQDAGMLESVFPAPGDSPATVATKKQQVIKMAQEKMHFPILQAYGIRPESFGRYVASGQSRIPEGKPVFKKP